MKKVYAPLGYTIDWEEARDWLNGDDEKEIRSFILEMAEWDAKTRKKIADGSLGDLLTMLEANGFVIEEE